MYPIFQIRKLRSRESKALPKATQQECGNLRLEACFLHLKLVLLPLSIFLHQFSMKIHQKTLPVFLAGFTIPGD